MTRAQPLIRDPRLIYVSWFPGGEEPYVQWVDHFYDKVLVETTGTQGRDGRPRFERAQRTGDQAASTVIDVDAVLERVTDIVAVLTNKYALVNQGTAPGSGELARFIALRRADTTDSGGRRAWITPLEKFNYDQVVIRETKLSDQACWLIRLKPSKQRFPLPPDPAYGDEIFDAVEEILGELNDEEG
jgi:hypothetical protein